MTMRARLTAILLLGCTFAFASAGAQAFERCEPFTVFTDHDTHDRASIDHGDEGPTVGDRRIFHALFRNEAGDVVGHGDGELTVIHSDAEGNAQFIADIVLQFPTGNIVYKIAPVRHEPDFHDTSAFIRPSPDAHRIIVAGSGVFVGASGTIAVDHKDNHSVFAVNVSCR